MIKLKKLTKIYQTNKENHVRALNGVSLSLPQKGFVFVVGKSGSGKSTLLHILGGLDNFDSGEMFIHEKPTTSYTSQDFDYYRNTSIGFIFQEYNLIDSLSVKENILIATNLQNKKVLDKELISLLELVDLDNVLNRMPNELSGGQRQRIAIARALVKNPEIILADEPTGSLDDKTSEQIYDLLKRLSEDKLVIVVSHDLDFAKKYATRIIELKDGSILSDTHPNQQIITNPIQNMQIESHFSIKNAISFAIKDFISKPLRMVFMIFLLTISFLLFGLSHTVSQYKIEKATFQSMELADIDYASLSQLYRVNHLGSIYQMHPLISSDQINHLHASYGNQSFFPVIDGFESSYRNYLYEHNTSNFSFEDFTGAVELTHELIEAFDLSLFAGSYPNISSSPMEIAISKRVFDVFREYGFIENNIKVSINNPSDLIDKNITINGKNYKISGIIDTNYDDSRYENIYENFQESIGYDILTNELKNLHQYSIHNLVFLGENYHRDIIDSIQNSNTYDNSIDFRIYMEDSGLNGYYTQTSSLSTLKTIPDQVIWKDGIERTSLLDHEVMISINMIPLNTSINSLNTFAAEREEKTAEAIETFAIARFDEIKTDFDSNFPGTNTYIDYIDYITNAYQNVFHEGYTYEYFYYQATKDIITSDYFSAFEDIILQGIQLVYTKEYNIEIVGVYDTTDFRGSPNDEVIIVSDTLFDTLSNDLFLYDYSRVLVHMDERDYDSLEFVEYSFEDSSNPHWVISNEVVGTLNYIDNILNQVSTLTFYFGILFAVFSSILLYGYISIMIGNREKDIGILRALGARKVDVMKIFVLESLLIGFAAFCLASLAGYIINLIINQILVNRYNLIISILNFGLVQVIIIFMLSIGVSMLSSILPIYRLSLKKPIDVIKGI